VVLSLLLYPAPFFGKNAAMAQTTAPECPNTFANPLYGIKMQYPTDWFKMEGGFVSRLANNNTVPVAVFYSPDCSVDVDIGIQKLQKKTTLNQYTDQDIAMLKSRKTMSSHNYQTDYRVNI